MFVYCGKIKTMETTQKTDKRKTTLGIDSDLAREVKIMAVLKNVKVKDYAEQALREKLAKDVKETRDQ